MNIVIKRKEDTNVTYEQIVELLHLSFEERLQQGLKFTCSFMTVDDYTKRNANGYIFVAVDSETSELMGVAEVHIKKDKRGVFYGYNENLAVSPKAKRCGIGSNLLKARENLCRELGCAYIMCDTAVGAVSSVKYHLKNNFKIIGLRSYVSTNYYSYLFRKQLIPSKFWDNPFICKILFFKSALVTKIKYKEDGSKTFFALVMSKLILKK